MKDLYDLYTLSREFSFDGAILSEAIKKTFARRKTELPTKLPVMFTSEFFDDTDKKKQWAAFCNKNRDYIAEISLEAVCKQLATFLMPIVEGLNGKADIPKRWLKGTWAN